MKWYNETYICWTPILTNKNNDNVISSNRVFIVLKRFIISNVIMRLYDFYLLLYLLSDIYIFCLLLRCCIIMVVEGVLGKYEFYVSSLQKFTFTNGMFLTLQGLVILTSSPDRDGWYIDIWKFVWRAAGQYLLGFRWLAPTIRSYLSAERATYEQWRLKRRAQRVGKLTRHTSFPSHRTDHKRRSPLGYVPFSRLVQLN